jgi:hypothetical protein
MKLEFILKILEKYINTKFQENPSCGSQVVPWVRTDGQTDMKKLTVVFRNFANAPNIHTFRVLNKSEYTKYKVALFVTEIGW